MMIRVLSRLRFLPLAASLCLTVSYSQLTVKLSLNQSVYCQRDPVGFSLTIHNAADTAVTLEFPTSQHFDFSIHRYGAWSDSRTFQQIATTATIPPHDSLTWSESFAPPVIYPPGHTGMAVGWIGDRDRRVLFGSDSMMFVTQDHDGTVTAAALKDTFYQYEWIAADISVTNPGSCDIRLISSECQIVHLGVIGHGWSSDEIACIPFASYLEVPSESSVTDQYEFPKAMPPGSYTAVGFIGSPRAPVISYGADSFTVTVIPHEYEMIVSTDKHEYGYDEDIIVTMRFINTTDASLRFSYDTQQRFDYCIDSAWCWSDDRSIENGQALWTVGPFAEVIFWDTIRAAVPDGKRTISAWLGTKNKALFFGGDSTEFTVLPPPLKMTMRTSKYQYQTGEPVTIEFQYENHTDNIRELKFSTDCHYAYSVNGGMPITEHEDCAAESSTVSLEPRTAVKWEATYDEYLEPGLYHITGWIGGPDSATGYGVMRTGIEVIQGDVVRATMSTAEGWVLFSLPLDPVSGAMGAGFSNAASAAFAYENDYVQADSLRSGVGYWMKFSGGAVDFVGRRKWADTIEVREGWNLIGTLSQVIPLENVSTIPDNNLGSDFFGFTANDGYKPATQLLSGRGYWIRALGPGKIILKK